MKALDPVFLGLHAIDESSSGQLSSKMVPKTSYNEKVGVFCQIDGRNRVIEYSDLPEDLARSQSEDGHLGTSRDRSPSTCSRSTSWTGSPGRKGPPRCPCTGPARRSRTSRCRPGSWSSPRNPTPPKLEMFIFDATPLADRSMVCETDRVEEFAPIKNAQGADSPATSCTLQIERAARWLGCRGAGPQEAGAPSAKIEISALSAMGPADLEHLDLPKAIEPGDELVI